MSLECFINTKAILVKIIEKLRKKIMHHLQGMRNYMLTYQSLDHLEDVLLRAQQAKLQTKSGQSLSFTELGLVSS